MYILRDTTKYPNLRAKQTSSHNFVVVLILIIFMARVLLFVDGKFFCLSLPLHQGCLISTLYRGVGLGWVAIATEAMV
jgi:hypothetical protein